MSEHANRQHHCRAAEDFIYIRRRVRELQAARIRPSSSRLTGKNDPAGFDVICTQPGPEDLGIIDSGGGAIAIRRGVAP